VLLKFERMFSCFEIISVFIVIYFVAQDTEKLWALVNMVMNIWVS